MGVMSQGDVEDPTTYAGTLSFLRRSYTRDIAEVDVVVTGIPFDAATSGRPGARFGPRAIRAASVSYATCTLALPSLKLNAPRGFLCGRETDDWS